MQSLPHLHASMREENRAISVDMEKSSCLVEKYTKCKAVFVWNDGKSSLLPLVRPEFEYNQQLKA